MATDKESLDMSIEEDFHRKVGMRPEELIALYQRAVENDWRTIQTTTQQAFMRFAASRASEGEAADLLKLARAILAAENADHLSRAGLTP